LKTGRIITWGYDSSVIKAVKAASHATIFGHSESLLAELARLRRDGAVRVEVLLSHNVSDLFRRIGLLSLLGIVWEDLL